MKFARLVYGNNRKQLQSKQYCNLGDYFQTFAVDQIYHEMGISSDHIVSIKKDELTQYQNEEVLLPMEGWFGYIAGTDIYPLSSKVHPIYIGYHCLSSHHYKKPIVDVYRKHQPIGCRDEATYHKMRSHKIDAYISGCLTFLLPKREDGIETYRRNKIFLIDVPKQIKEMIPKEYADSIVELTQEMPIQTGNPDHVEIERLEKLAKERLELYRNEAALIVTSRLHCGSPGLGMGIPVIMVREYFDDRYSWLDRYVKLYTPDRFQEIDFSEEGISRIAKEQAQVMEYIRPKLMKMAIATINNAAEHTEENYNPGITVEQQEIHDWYMNRKKETITNPVKMVVFMKLHEYAPKLTDFLRESVFARFTVASGRDSKDNEKAE